MEQHASAGTNVTVLAKMELIYWTRPGLMLRKWKSRKKKRKQMKGSYTGWVKTGCIIADVLLKNSCKII